MNKIIIVLLSLVVTTVIGQSCSDNVLRGQFDLTFLNGPTAISGLNYCKSLKNSDSCCSADIINTFQDRTDELLERLTKAVIARDQYLIQAREELSDNFAKIERFIEAFEAAWPIYSQDIENGNVGRTVQMLLMASESLYQTSFPLFQETEAFIANFTTFQKARSTCFVELVKNQAASWCLACDPNAGDYLLGSNNLDFASEFKTRVIDACYDYLELSFSQSIIFMPRLGLPRIDNLTLWLENAAQGNEISNEETLVFIMEYVEPKLVEMGSNSTTAPGEGFVCDSRQDCDFILGELFYRGLLDEDKLIVGGKFGESRNRKVKENFLHSRAKRLLTSLEILRTRKLQGGSGGWNPDSDEAGVLAEFPEDPANINCLGSNCQQPRGGSSGISGYYLRLFISNLNRWSYCNNRCRICGFILSCCICYYLVNHLLLVKYS